MMGKITQVSNAKYAKDGWQLLRNRKTLWCMLKASWKGQYRMSLFTSLIMVLGILYVIIPLDFDWIPFIGWIDDIAVIIFIIKRLQKETQRFNRHKAMERRMECRE